MFNVFSAENRWEDSDKFNLTNRTKHHYIKESIGHNGFGAYLHSATVATAVTNSYQHCFSLDNLVL
jgi:hypothetical protein